MPTAFRRRTDLLHSVPDPAADAALPTLEATRLRLRWMDPGDLPELTRLFADRGDSRSWNRGGGGDHDEASIYLESVARAFELGHQFQWGIALSDDDRVIGTATLYAIDHLQGRADVGFALADAFCGYGYAREALSVLVRHAFDRLQLRRLEADVDPGSKAALRTLEHLGFRREGYLRQRWRIGGTLQDSVVMGLLASDPRPPA